jgi:putative glutamine amidotransferase
MSVTVGVSPERAFVNSAYLEAVSRPGGIPLLLAPSHSPAARAALWARASGLLLTGGGDIDPAHFGEAPHPTAADVSAARDDLEIDLTRRALAEGVPLLAVCRGIQVLNVALGGSLYQDIPSEPGSPIAHSQREPRARATHAVKVQPGSRLGDVLGRLDVDVNSMHHQAIRRAGDGLRVVAWAADGIVEGAEVPGHPFALAVQWHPEELIGHDAAARNLFGALVAAANAYGPRR